jgi:hypothetical protein
MQKIHVPAQFAENEKVEVEQREELLDSGEIHSDVAPRLDTLLHLVNESEVAPRQIEQEQEKIKSLYEHLLPKIEQPSQSVEKAPKASYAFLDLIADSIVQTAPTAPAEVEATPQEVQPQQRISHVMDSSKPQTKLRQVKEKVEEERGKKEEHDHPFRVLLENYFQSFKVWQKANIDLDRLEDEASTLYSSTWSHETITVTGEGRCADVEPVKRDLEYSVARLNAETVR